MKNRGYNTKSTLALLVGACMASAFSGGVMAQKSNGATNGQPFQALQESINAEEAARIAADAAEAAIRAAQDTLLQDHINAVAEDLADLEDSVSISVSQLESDVASLESVVGAIEDELDILYDDVETNADAIAALEQDVSGMAAELAGKQDILNGACPRNSSLRVIFPDGGFLCEFDTVGRVSTLLRAGGYGRAFRSPISTRQGTSFATCPNGWRVSGGGHDTRRLRYASEVNLLSSKQSRTTQWAVTFSNTESRNYVEYVRAFATCVR